MIPALDPHPESDFQPFGNSGSGVRSSKKRNHNNSGPGSPIQSWIFRLLVIPDPDSVKSGIATPLTES